jgi:glycosylphosphatidylinositol transamidase
MTMKETDMASQKDASIKASDTQANQNKMEDETKTKKKKRTWLPALVLPYLIGIAWHLLHPAVSVFTGKLAPRRWYIDENSLEPAHFRMDAVYHLARNDVKDDGESLCEALAADPVPCHASIDFEVAQVLPRSTAVTPVTEAIVLVVSGCGDDRQFRFSVKQLIRRLAGQPWLAKTVLIVTPTARVTTEQAVKSFLDAYLGPTSGKASRNSALPFTGAATIRNFLVLDLLQQAEEDSSCEVRILPTGRRGVLPNMDLTFTAKYVYSRANFLQTRGCHLIVHPYREKARTVWEWSRQTTSMPKKMEDWFRQFLHLAAFEASAAVGPCPPHAAALDRGLDAVTVQAVFPTTSPTHWKAETVQKMEYVIRSLSNLHERLHHSTALYLLPSPDSFVKHEEYLVPNLLLIIPLVLRALVTALDWPFPLPPQPAAWQAAATAGGLTSLAVVASSWALEAHTRLDFLVTAGRLVLVYAISLLTWWWTTRNLNSTVSETAHCVQFVACLVAICVHVSIAFGHVSLAFPSALIWTPLLAFPSYRTKEKSGGVLSFSISVLLTTVAVVVTFPATFLVPNVFPVWTPYVRYAYMPLHILFTMMQLLLQVG